jgi:hypothetical protein
MEAKKRAERIACIKGPFIRAGTWITSAVSLSIFQRKHSTHLTYLNSDDSISSDQDLGRADPCRIRAPHKETSWCGEEEVKGVICSCDISFMLTATSADILRAHSLPNDSCFRFASLFGGMSWSWIFVLARSPLQ